MEVGEESEKKDKIIAKVNGIPLYLSQLEFLVSFKRKEDDSEEYIKQGLEAIINLELLYQYAKGKGLKVKDDELREIRRKAMVQRFLEDQFEKRLKLPEEELRKAYEANKRLFVHSQLRKVIHILVRIPLKKKDDRDYVEKALNLANEIYEKAKECQNSEEFYDIGLNYQFNTKEFNVTVERIRYFSKEDQLEDSFLEASFNLKEIGDISPPVKTNYGYHIIFLEDILPPENKNFEEAKEEVRRFHLPYYQKRVFEETLKELIKKYKVEGYNPLPHQKGEKLSPYL